MPNRKVCFQFYSLITLISVLWLTSVGSASAADSKDAPDGKAAWKCSANGLAEAEYDGSSGAYIRLGRYRSGNTYPVTLNEERTEATGKTSDGTPFKCVRTN